MISRVLQGSDKFQQSEKQKKKWAKRIEVGQCVMILKSIVSQT